MENNNSPAYYAVIPPAVRYDPELSANAKLLYGEISALENVKGYCWAQNSYFAELYGKDEKTISRWINALEKRGYIRREIIRNSKSEVTERRIYVVGAMPAPGGDKNADTSPQKASDPTDKNADTSGQKASDPPRKNAKENNIRESNTREDMPAPLRSREKKPYGEMRNVLLSDREFHSLLVRYPREQVEAEIESLSLYMSSQGKRYSSHYATLLNWLRKDAQRSGSVSAPMTVVDMEEY